MTDLRRRTGLLAAGAAAAALLLTACGDSGSGDQEPDAGSTPAGQQESAPGAAPDDTESPSDADSTDSTGDSGDTGDTAAVPAELRWTAPAVGGGEFDAATLAGSPAVLWFWAPWCVICQGEAPGIKAAHEEWGEQVTFVGVSGHGGESQDETFVNTFGLDGFDHARDVDGSLWTDFGVASQPAFAFISKSGSVEVVPGSLDEQELDSRLAELTSQ
ncbi:TlpA family protein disulfide reductase [Streptomyces aidingensis]|uniref:Thiol-disulfide isomerase or thioredoxin n=1 Tax=Streptomyces aidingensis TaxID=910347 RepID=A0A1I1FBZ0_9ACTN|nr:redoxin domain-containing protein [Streptomyces aidingensis]SFB95208.1 Thiol-disulfide isomerase or thioredoxin [Streptomyces aidingensis]